MEWIIFLVIVVVILLGATKSPKEKGYAYRQRGPLFTKAERSFLGVLEKSIEGKYRVYGKVRVADILSPEKGLDRKSWQVAFNKISAKHFDYVLCENSTLDIVAVVELDDKSHGSKKSVARDALLQKACESAKLKLIRFPAKANYQVPVVRANIEKALNPVVDPVVLNKAM